VRKSILTILVAGTAFMLTAAAAGAITATGPFNPRGGSDARAQCDLGAITVGTNVSVLSVSGFSITTINNGASLDGCIGKWLWVRVSYQPLDPSTGVATGAAAALYKAFDAHINYTSGTTVLVGSMYATVHTAFTGRIPPANWLFSTHDILGAVVLITDGAEPIGF